MKTVDEQTCRAPADVCFKLAVDVEQWPQILSHYRWVRFHERPGFAKSVVEMAAWRPFPGFRYPTWWLSEMEFDVDARTVTYRHIDGITKGMDVVWRVEDLGDGNSNLSILHEWTGPKWPLIGRVAADWIIGPHFVKHIAGRTLEGIAQMAEAQSAGAQGGTVQ